MAHLATPTDGNPGLEYGWVKCIRNIERESAIYSEESFSRGGDKVGWIDGDNIYLNPESAYNAASDMNYIIGDTITTSERMLKKFLVQDEMLASTGLNTSRKTITIVAQRRMIVRARIHLLARVLTRVIILK